MVSPTATTRSKTVSALTRPTSVARRTAHREPEEQLRGLDAWFEIGLGRWRRRGAALNYLLRAAEQVDALGPDWNKLSDSQLRQRIEALREIFRRGGRELTAQCELEALAAVREVSERKLGMRPFTVQIAGALALRRGLLAEMATGEGKTLTAAVAAVLAGWTGRPCHVITVNDYLAERDAVRMGPLYHGCGVRVGHVIGPMTPRERRAGYDADVTYTTSKEVVADFLRDRLHLGPLHDPERRLLRRLLALDGRPAESWLVMRGLHTAIVDEADSVLIDEAVTPLIISRAVPNEELEEACRAAFRAAADFERDRDYRADFRARRIDFTPAGEARLERVRGMFSGVWRGPKRVGELIRQSLSAREFFLRDRQYAVVDGKVVIVDEFTGRQMPGRTWREGLHQAVEAKEGLPVSAPSETLARISFQRYFRLYEKLSGMTGTAAEAADEFWLTYRLPVIRIPTNKPCIRSIREDEVFPDLSSKWTAIVQRIVDLHSKGIPVLVGTRHVSSSEELARRLTEVGIEFNLLNAIHHKEEARIVAEAGQMGRVTVATNMAGRGTDIHLGEGVAALGGLRVIATERHEAGRIDRQLFGRCARQGDPGEVHVFVSVEDELLQRYVPAAVRRALAAGLSAGRAGARGAALTAVRYAQWLAQRQAWLQRREVLRQDTWIDEALAFTARSRYS